VIDFGFLDDSEQIFDEYLNFSERVDPGLYSFRISIKVIDPATGRRVERQLYLENLKSLGTYSELKQTLFEHARDTVLGESDITPIKGSVKILAGYRG
jgi:hypothetical protein